MDKRSWPWKKKSSEKQVVEKAVATVLDSSVAASDSSATQIDQTKQENSNKKIKYVQITMESYTHLTGLEDQMKSYEEQAKTLEDEVAELNEKLSEANSEIDNKEILVKQHIKVSEEAVSGWEKAEAEALALKSHLESVTLLKLTAEDRASHLDGALKECMRQMRNLKEEHDQKLHEVVLNKAKLFDKMKIELETKIANLDQEMFRSAAENASLSRSLQERSNMLIELNEEKSQTDTEIQLLKSKIESCEREVNSHKYELHIARKEVEIRNEEKNMSVRSAEVANRQHLEGVKKIAKLEAECQRLRGLVRKRLPGPAALAQMKLEVENLGRDYGESRVRRSHVRPSTPHLSQLPEFSLDNSLMYQKDNELLTERLQAMDEETKMLKEALAKRNSELQTSRSLFAQTSTKLQSLEAQLQVDGGLRFSPRSNALACIEGLSSHNVINPSSFTSLSVDGNDDSVSCASSWATEVMSDFSHAKKGKNTDGTQKTGNTNHLDLMDDFLEMEKLAYHSSGNVSDPGVSGNKGHAASEIVKHEVSLECKTGTDPLSKGAGSDAWLSSKDVTVTNPHLQAYSLTIANLQSKISMILELLSTEKGAEKVMEEVRQAVQDMQESLDYLPMSIIVQTDRSISENDVNSLARDAKIAAVKGEPSSEEDNSYAETEQTFNHELEIAISQIYDFLMILGKEAKAIPVSTDGDELDKKLNIFSAKYGESTKEINLNDYVIEVSNVLSKVSALNLNILGFKSSEVETVSSDCIDKIALPENKDSLSEDRYPNGCAHFSYSASDPDVPHDGNLVPTSESTTTSWKCSLEEFEQLKLEKDNNAVDLARCIENFEMSQSKLLETELLLAEVKSQLTSAQKANSLAETQLKCMAESYNSLETRAEELQNKVNLLQVKIETLDKELQDERKCHQDVLTRCKDLQEQLQRIDSCAAVESDEKIGQDMELAAAAEKLAECQETIFLLGKQLKALRPQTEFPSPQSNRRIHKSEYATDEEPTLSDLNLQDAPSSEVDTATGFNLHRAGSESSSDILNAACSPPDSETNNILKSPVSKYAKHRPTNSGSPSSSSSSSSTPTPEKQSRGFSRFFSSK